MRFRAIHVWQIATVLHWPKSRTVLAVGVTAGRGVSQWGCSLSTCISAMNHVMWLLSMPLGAALRELDHHQQSANRREGILRIAFFKSVSYRRTFPPDLTRHPGAWQPFLARLSSMADPVNRSRLRTAWVVAVLVDGLQMITWPAEMTGPMAWVLEVGLDLVTMSLMILLVGFHWAFLPSFVTKLLPFVDLAPTWTLALFIATRDRKKMKPFNQA